MENKDENLKEDDIDKALERQYGIDAVNREYADEASVEDNRTSFEKEKDEEINSKVVESKKQGSTVVIKNINEDDNNSNTKPNDQQQKKIKPLPLISFVIAVVALLICITLAILDIVIVNQQTISQQLADIHSLVRIFAWVFFLGSLLIDIIGLIITTKEKLIKYAFIITILGVAIIIITEYILTLIH